MDRIKVRARDVRVGDQIGTHPVVAVELMGQDQPLVRVRYGRPERPMTMLYNPTESVWVVR